MNPLKYIRYVSELENTWNCENGETYKTGDIIDVSKNNAIHVIIGFSQSCIKTCELIRINEVVPFYGVLIEGKFYSLNRNKTYLIPKREYRKIYPDKYHIDALKLKKPDDLENHNHEWIPYQIPNKEDKFECKLLNCCSEKQWKVYTRQEYFEHLNSILLDKYTQLNSNNLPIRERRDIMELIFELKEVRKFIIEFDRKNDEHMEKLELDYPYYVELVRRD